MHVGKPAKFSIPRIIGESCVLNHPPMESRVARRNGQPGGKKNHQLDDLDVPPYPKLFFFGAPKMMRRQQEGFNQ